MYHGNFGMEGRDVSTYAVTAMFASNADAERAAQRIVTTLRLSQAMVQTTHEAGSAGSRGELPARVGHARASALIDSLLIPDEDRRVLVEGLRRGCVIVSAWVEAVQAERATTLLEDAGALDLDEVEARWSGQGQSGPGVAPDLRSYP
jgi:hypothetical protein